MKTVNKTILDIINSDAIASAFVALLDFTLPDTSHLRYARYTSDVTYDGNDYTAWPFKGRLSANGTGHSVVTVSLTIEDATRALRPSAIATNWFRSTVLTMTMVCVDELALDYTWSTVAYDILHAAPQGEAIVLKLGGPNPLKLRFPADRYWADQCPYARGFKDDPRCGYSGGETTCDGSYADCAARSNQTRYGGFFGLDPNGAKLVVPQALRGLV